jgi:hypothetical protein
LGSGNVGINTTSPTSKLQVVDSHFDLTSANKNGISIADDAFGIGLFTPALGFGYNGNFEAGLAGVYGSADNNQLGLMFFTHPSSTSTDDSVEAMRITYDGNVGIGTDNPGHVFTVDKSSGAVNTPIAWIHNSGNFANYDGAVISCVNDGSDAEVLHVRTNNTTYNGGTSLMLVRGDGHVGIGTDDPLSALDVNTGTITLREGSTIYHQITSNSDGLNIINNAPAANVTRNIIFKSSVTGGSITEKMRITGAGNVGIGITSPSQKLDVAGAGRFTSGVIVPETTNGGFEYRTNSAWGGWARDAFTIANGTGGKFFSLGGYGGSGTTFTYGYIGKSYTDYCIRFYLDGAVELHLRLMEMRL